jgi:hypothetical protein
MSVVWFYLTGDSLEAFAERLERGGCATRGIFAIPREKE